MSSLWPVSGDAAGILAQLREWDQADDPRPLVIETSGSTGEPKRVVLSRDAMRASALATHERLDGPGRWVLTLPATYVAGVQVLYRCVVAGTEPVLDPQGHGDYVSVVPTQLVRALAGDASQLERARTVLVGGGPLRPQIREQASARGIRVVQTYGMSETCGGCVYDGVPLDGVEVRIDDDEVLVRGPVLFDGYLGEEERTREAFRDGWLVTHDLGHLDPDGRLQIDGRADDVIISGGVKVPAGAVAAQLAPHVDGDLEVFGVPDPEWGERVVVAVAGGVAPTLEHLRDLVSPREWAPRRLLVVRDLPLLPNGKHDLQALRGLGDA